MTSSTAPAIIAFAFIICANIQHVFSFQMPHQAFRIALPSGNPLQVNTDTPSIITRTRAISTLCASPSDANCMEDDSNDASVLPSDKAQIQIQAQIQASSKDPNITTGKYFAPSSASTTNNSNNDDLLNFAGLGEFDPSKKIPVKREVLVGNPQLKVRKKEKSVTTILQELAEIQKQGPKKYCLIGTRHCSYLHQQIIELLSYALVLSENHVYTSGAGGTNAAAIRGALRANRPDLLTVILPQSLGKQSREAQELLKDVTDLVAMPQNDEMSLNVASRLCNSKLLSETDQLIAFAFHESKTVIEATKEAKKLEMLVTKLFLD